MLLSGDALKGDTLSRSRVNYATSLVVFSVAHSMLNFQAVPGDGRGARTQEKGIFTLLGPRIIQWTSVLLLSVSPV